MSLTPLDYAPEPSTRTSELVQVTTPVPHPVYVLEALHHHTRYSLLALSAWHRLTQYEAQQECSLTLQVSALPLASSHTSLELVGQSAFEVGYVQALVRDACQ